MVREKVIEMIEDYINSLLTDISDDYRADYVNILYDEYLEAMYGTDPRFFGPDWDELA